MKSAAAIMAAPVRYTHQERRFMRGNATSLAPIIRGRRKFPKATGTPGIMKRNIMIMPWVVKTSL